MSNRSVNNMPLITGQLNDVINKTQRLINLCFVLQEENDLLRLQNQHLETAFEASKSKKLDLEEMVRVLKLARSLEGVPQNELGPNEKALDTKQKISNFVSEIDKCIVLLKKQY